jgi:hypothetical protein
MMQLNREDFVTSVEDCIDGSEELSESIDGIRDAADKSI